jgi:hypothetical protein
MSESLVYRIRWEDLEHYQALLYDLPETPQALQWFDGTSKGDWWDAPPVYSDMPRLKAPDLWHLVGVATIVMSLEVVEELAAFLHPVGELLPLRMSGTGEGLLALNILRDVDCLNLERYRDAELEVWTDFVPHRLPESGLFKVPQVDRVEIFYLERSDDGETLRARISENDYHGIIFEPVWSSDGDVEPINLVAM